MASQIKAEILNGPLYFLQDPLFNMGRLGFVGQRGEIKVKILELSAPSSQFRVRKNPYTETD